MDRGRFSRDTSSSSSESLAFPFTKGVGRPRVNSKDKGNSLSPAPNAANRATVTCDSHGIILSANAAMASVFGYEPHEVLDKSCRILLQLQRKGPAEKRGLGRTPSSERFSRTDIWRDALDDLMAVTVVNGRRKSGTVQPMVMSVSEMHVGADTLFALLFEALAPHTALLTTDHEGVVLSATENARSFLGVPARELHGRALGELVRAPAHCGANFLQWSVERGPAARYGKEAKHILGCTLGVEGLALHKELALQVIDVRSNMFVVTVGLMSDALLKDDEMSAPTSGMDPLAKGGLTKNTRLRTEEVGYYTMQEALGVGQCGYVRAGVHRLTGVRVAVKTLTEDKSRDLGLTWPPRELELMKSISHPNLVLLYDCISSGASLVLVMEYVAGGELLGYCLEQGLLMESQARGFFRDVVAAVDYLHRKGIVHRDLKLENCLLDEKRRVKVTDFGLANYTNKGPLKTSCGSADYAAPELFMSTKYSGPPVDVWALGVMLYAMVAGEFPFEDVQATLDREYTWPDKIIPSKSLRDLIDDMFELNPDLRLTVEQVRRNEWVNFGHKDMPPRPRSAALGESAQIRADLLLKMEHRMGFAVEAVVDSLLDGAVNQFTATYKILLVKYPTPIVFEEGKSPADFLIFCNPERQAAVKSAIKQAERRRERGIILDLANLRSLVRRRSLSPEDTDDGLGLASGTPRRRGETVTSPTSARDNRRASMVVRPLRADESDGPLLEATSPIEADPLLNMQRPGHAVSDPRLKEKRDNVSGYGLLGLARMARVRAKSRAEGEKPEDGHGEEQHQQHQQIQDEEEGEDEEAPDTPPRNAAKRFFQIGRGRKPALTAAAKNTSLKRVPTKK